MSCLYRKILPANSASYINLVVGQKLEEFKGRDSEIAKTPPFDKLECDTFLGGPLSFVGNLELISFMQRIEEEEEVEEVKKLVLE